MDTKNIGVNISGFDFSITHFIQLSERYSMHSFAQDYPAVLLRNEETPCLSLYQSTHRQHPDNVQDPIRFRNLVKELEE